MIIDKVMVVVIFTVIVIVTVIVIITVILMILVMVILMVILEFVFMAIVNKQGYRVTLDTIMCMIIDKVIGLDMVIVTVIVI